MPEPGADPAPFEALELSVDDLGSYLVVFADELTLGAATDRTADLPVTADLPGPPLRLVRSVSFHGGAAWTVFADDEVAATVGGRPVGATGERLSDGERLAVGERLGLRFSQPDPAGTAALVELERGLECLGHRTVALVGEGEAGGLRVGPSPHAHLQSPVPSEDVRVWRAGGRLWIAGAVTPRSVRDLAEAAVRDRALGVPLPLHERVDLLVGRATAERPPFGIGLAPLE